MIDYRLYRDISMCQEHFILSIHKKVFRHLIEKEQLNWYVSNQSLFNFKSESSEL